MTIGIPRALFYWKEPCLWPTFFKKLGFDVLLSPLSNKEIIEAGTKIADPDTCFSIKVLYGHILWLEGKADLIFVPLLKRNELKFEYCPKFFALPDLFSKFIKSQLLSPRIDLANDKLENVFLRFGKKMKLEKRAVREAITFTFLEREKKEKEIKEEYFKKIQSPKEKIVLISHPYNLYDEYVNLRIKKTIEDFGREVILIDEVPLPQPLESFKEYQSKFHWEFCDEILFRIEEVIKTGISGAVEISAFQCGCDSVLKEFIEPEFKKKKIPFLYLLIDEHTAEAGLQTRLEAFCDTL